MNQPKNSLTIILMLSSIVLLIALQVFWLTNSYEKAYFDLRKETSNLFRTTVLAMRDSMFIKRFEHIPPDSLTKGDIKWERTIDSLHGGGKRRFQFKQNSSQIQIFVSTDRKTDSIQAILKPFASQIQEGKFGGGGNFILRIGPDSLATDSLKSHFKEVISKTYGALPFKVKQESFLPPPLTREHIRTVFRNSDENGSDGRGPGIFSGSLESDWVRLDPAHRYAVVLSDFQSILLREIAPQILFSIFLTLLTTGSFVIIYRSLRAQQRLMILKNDFISNVTHELKTPIATVSVALEALKSFKGIDNPKLTSEYLEIAQHELGRLSLLTDKVLTTSLFDEHGIKIDLEKVDLEKTLQEILKSMRLVFEKQDAVVQFEKSGSDFTIPGSSVHLTNVIYNLLDNALKYSPSNPAIRVTLKDLGEEISLEVADQGLGIPNEFHKKIFEKFFRMPTGDVHNVKGYGLGLSYVKSVVIAHKGTIEVDSELGQGSTLTIHLPHQS